MVSQFLAFPFGPHFLPSPFSFLISRLTCTSRNRPTVADLCYSLGHLHRVPVHPTKLLLVENGEFPPAQNGLRSKSAKNKKNSIFSWVKVVVKSEKKEVGKSPEFPIRPVVDWQ
jgi:hypothetical protein